METSRKRFNTDNDTGGNKRKSRKSKAKQNEEEIIDEISTETQDEEDVFLKESNNSDIITLQLIPRSSFTEEIDKKIIKYFKSNMHLLNMRDEISIYHILKAKCGIQKSVKSLQLRFVNVILPNLFKYNVMNHADLIDFYDAAQLELPDEFIKILNETETSKEKTKSTPVQIENIIVPGTSRQFEASEASRGKKCNNLVDAHKERESSTPSTSRQSGGRAEVPCPQPSSRTSEDTSLKSILGFIQFSNSKGTCVFIPDTEPNIQSVKKRLLEEFQIQPDSVKIVRKSRFDKLKQLKEQFDVYKEVMVDAFLNQRNALVERMFPDAKELLKLMQERNRQPHSNEFPVENNNSNSDVINNTIESWPDIEIDNMGQLIASLSDSLDHVSISSNNESHSESHSPNKSLAEVKTEPEDQDEVETVVRSPYFVDHTYCKNNERSDTSPNNNQNANESENNSPENNMDNSLNNILFENACIPQIVFSKRCQDKIASENINVDHLLIDVRSKCDETSNVEGSGDNKTNESEAK